MLFSKRVTGAHHLTVNIGRGPGGAGVGYTWAPRRIQAFLLGARTAWRMLRIRWLLGARAMDVVYHPAGYYCGAGSGEPTLMVRFRDCRVQTCTTFAAHRARSILYEVAIDLGQDAIAVLSEQPGRKVGMFVGPRRSSYIWDGTRFIT